MSEKLYGLHSVNLYGKYADPENLAEAKKIAKDIMNKKPGYFRRTKTSIRFRNIPKTRFEKKTFRTKVVNKNVHLVFGKIKKEFVHLYDELEGEGIFENVKGFFSTLFSGNKDFNKRSQEVLKQFGNNKVISLELYRTPIDSTVKKILDFVSLGKMSQMMGRYNYDDMFHVGLICKIETDKGLKNIILEKNEEINVNTNYNTSDTTEVLPVSMKGQELTPVKLLECGKKIQGDKFFDYDGFGGNNCQNFLKDILTGCNLYDDKINKWLFQPVDELVKGLPKFTPVIGKIATRLKSAFNRLLGRGIPLDINEQTIKVFRALKKNKDYIDALNKL